MGQLSIQVQGRISLNDHAAIVGLMAILGVPVQLDVYRGKEKGIPYTNYLFKTRRKRLWDEVRPKFMRIKNIQKRSIVVEAGKHNWENYKLCHTAYDKMRNLTGRQ